MDETEILARLLEHPAGFEVSLGRELSACRLDQGSFVVEYEAKGRDGDPVLKEKSFTTAPAAAEFFIKRRHEKKLGADLDEIDLD